MNKNWLIRTKNNHILGPVSLGKIKTLLENKSLNLEDELCSGNGYWFSIKEEELVDKYINQEIPQGYNPVSEAKTNLARTIELSEEPLEEVSDDVTKVGLSLEGLHSQEADELGELDLDIELADPGEPPFVELPKKESQQQEVIEESPPDEPKSTNKVKKIEIKSQDDLRTAKVITSKMLYLLAILFFIIALAAFYYRKNLIETFI